MHPQYTVTLLCLRKLTPNAATDLPMRGPYANLNAYKQGMEHLPVRFKLDEVFSWTATAALPLLPDDLAAEVFAQIRKAPNLDTDDGQSWRARPYMELNATNDKKYMELVQQPEAGWWPVYKGASFNIWEPDTGVYYAWAVLDKVFARLQSKRLRGNRNRRSAFYEFPREWVEDDRTYPAYKPRIAFRDITNRTNRRTIVTALIPPNVVAQNKAPVFLWPRGDVSDEAYLLGVLAAMPLDWYARGFVEINMNFHIVNALPIPRPRMQTLTSATPRSQDLIKHQLWRRVVALAGRLAAVDARYADWAAAVGVDCGPLEPARKDDMIFELDAVVAHLYGLDAAQLRHIFATFHVGWDYRERLRAVLQHFRAWAARL